MEYIGTPTIIVTKQEKETIVKFITKLKEFCDNNLERQVCGNCMFRNMCTAEEPFMWDIEELLKIVRTIQT